MATRNPRETPDDYVPGSASPPPDTPLQRAQLAANLTEMHPPADGEEVPFDEEG